MLVAEFEGQKPRDVVLLIDRSQSMGQRDRRVSSRDRLRVAIATNTVPLAARVDDTTLTVPAGTPTDPARADLIKAVLAHPELRLRQALAEKGPLRNFTFGQRLTTAEEALNVLQPDEPRTALADAIAEVLARNPGAPPAAIVVMTDGRDNASRALLEDVARTADGSASRCTSTAPAPPRRVCCSSATSPRPPRSFDDGRHPGPLPLAGVEAGHR
jgi:uncharacterized protein with von Willebrand factor type A (vWA) domain